MDREGRTEFVGRLEKTASQAFLASQGKREVPVVLVPQGHKAQPVILVWKASRDAMGRSVQMATMDVTANRGSGAPKAELEIREPLEAQVSPATPAPTDGKAAKEKKGHQVFLVHLALLGAPVRLDWMG